jgi:hypothetical protein
MQSKPVNYAMAGHDIVFRVEGGASRAPALLTSGAVTSGDELGCHGVSLSGRHGLLEDDEGPHA